MKFPKYPILYSNDKLIANIKRELPKEANSATWYVTEKIRGVQLNFLVLEDRVVAAKKGGYILKGESFYNHKNFMNELSPRLLKLRKKMKHDFVVYGELFGGLYDGVTKGEIISRMVQYHPENRYMAFDIALIEDGELAFFSRKEFAHLCYEYEIDYMPTLMYGTFDACLAFEHEVDSPMAKDEYGLPHINGNMCEGMIIRPLDVAFLSTGQFVAVKKTNILKSPVRMTITRIKNTDTEVTSMVNKLVKNLTKQRLSATIARLGKDASYAKVVSAFYSSALAEHGKEYKKLPKRQRKQINKLCNSVMSPMVREVLYG